MNTHQPKSALLNAYLDEELHPAARQEVEEHLRTCRVCQQEFEQLRRVSTMLQNIPLPNFQPAERFAANLTRRLTPHPSSTTRSRHASPSLYLVPISLLAIWLLWQMTTTFSNLLDLAQSTNLFPVLREGSGGHGQSLWITLTQLLAGQSTPPWLSALADLSQWSWSLQLAWLIQAGIAFAYWIWLFLLQWRPISYKQDLPFHFRS